MDQKFRKAIHRTIEGKEKSHTIYSALSHKADTPHLKNFFSSLALEECKHKEILKAFLETKNFYQSKDGIEEVFEIHDFSMKKQNLTYGFKDFKHGFLFVIKMEQKSVQRNKKLLSEAKLASLRDIFHFLYNEAAEHERLVRKNYYQFLDDAYCETHLCSFESDLLEAYD